MKPFSDINSAPSISYFAIETQRSPLRPPIPNIYAGPAAEEPPGTVVHICNDTLHLRLPLGEPDVLIDDHGFSDRQVDYDH